MLLNWFMSFCISVSTVQAAPLQGAFLIRDVTVIDMISDQPLPHHDVLIKNGKVAKLSKRLNLTGVQVINGKNKYLIPGLIDAHTHIIDSHSLLQRDISFQDDEFQLLLLNGITTIRNMKNFTRQLTLSQEIESRQRLAPRLYVTSPAVSDRKDKFENLEPTIHFVCDKAWSNCAIRDDQGAQEIAQKFKQEGYQAIKIREPMSEDMLFPFIKAIKSVGLQVVGHVYAFTAFPNLFKQNLFDSIEHPTGLFEYLESDNSPLRQPPYLNDSRVKFLFLRSFYSDPVKTKKIVKLAGQNYRGFFVPTLAVSKNLVDSASGPRDILSEPNQEFIDVCWKTKQNTSAYNTLESFKLYQEYQGPGTIPRAFANMQKLIGKFHSAGVKIATGTDFGIDNLVPGFSLHDEMKLLTQSGLSPFEALKAATLHGALLIGDFDLGIIRPGAKADLVLLNANPLDKIENTRKIEGVFRDGTWLDHEHLTKMATNIKQRAATFQCR